MEFHHLGIATDDAGGTATRLTTVIDASIAHEEEFAGMAVRFLAFDAGCLELLEPLEGGPLGELVDRQGTALHHVAFEVADIDARLAEAEEAGVGRIDETPREGAWNQTIAFLDPADTGGVLVEYVAGE